MKVKILFFLFFTSTLSIAQKDDGNFYNLDIGTTRYYVSCDGYFMTCTAQYTFTNAIEKVIADTVINNIEYSIVSYIEQTYEDATGQYFYSFDTTLQRVS